MIDGEALVVVYLHFSSSLNLILLFINNSKKDTFNQRIPSFAL